MDGFCGERDVGNVVVGGEGEEGDLGVEEEGEVEVDIELEFVIVDGYGVGFFFLRRVGLGLMNLIVWVS